MIKILTRSAYFPKIKCCLLVGLLVFWFGVAWGQNTDDYRTRQSGNWNANATWERFNGSIWETVTGTAPRTLPNSGDGVISIQNTHTVTVSASVTVDQVVVATGGQITINSGITLTINNGPGTDLSVSGTIQTNSTSSNAGFTNGGQIAFLAGGTYIHNVNGEPIPTATWESTSTARITGTVATAPTGLAQNFGNFIWNSSGMTATVNFNPSAIAGNFEINNSGGEIRQNIDTITIGKDLIISGGTFVITNGNNNRILNVSGNVEISGGTLIVKQGNNGSGTLNVKGNFSHTAGTITRSDSGTASINFNGSGTSQIFTSGETVSGTVNWTVNSGAFLQMAEEGSRVTGGGSFTLSSGATLGITSTNGITSSGASGNIQVLGSRSFNSGANYVYNGSVNQAVGNGLPATVNSLIIANSGSFGINSVTFDADRLISSDLGVESGTLDLANFTLNRETVGGSFYLDPNTTLRLSGTINFPSNFSNVNLDCSSTVEYYATGAQTLAAYNYGNLFLNGSGTKTLQTGTTQICSDFTLSGSASTSAVTGLTIGGEVSIGNGTSFDAGNFTHIISGNWINSGTFTAGNSTLHFNSTIPVFINTSLGVGSFANISFTGTGTKTINSTLFVSGNITPVSTNVVLSGSNTLTLNKEKIMEITSTGSLSTPGAGKLILEPSSIYVNRSTSNPTLEVQQTFTGTKGWRMFGSPINTTYENLTSGMETQGFPGSTNPTLQPNLLWWDETDKGTTLQGWRQPINLGDAVPAGRGHYLYVFDGDTKPGGGSYTDPLPKTISVTGTEVNLASGSFDFGVTFTERDSNLVAQADSLIEVNQTDEGFNLIANPTASTIDFDATSGWTKTNIDESIYVWDPATSSFLTWNGSVGTLGSGRLQPFQAFWVKANDASPVLRLTGNEAKSQLSTSFFGRKLEEKPLVIYLHLAGEGMEAESFISFEKDGDTGQDPKDAYQLESLAENWLLLYTFGSIKNQSPLVINNQPSLDEEEKVIPLHIAASKGGQAINGSYLMDWEIPDEWPADVQVVLMDHLNQKAIDMKAESMHSFNFQGPEIPNSGARKSLGEFATPQAVIFSSPYESGEVNARTTASEKPQRPFTIYIGAFPNDRIEYLPDFPKLFAPAPNPFRTQTKIRFYMPVVEKAAVSIYNLLGQEVGNFPAQEYEAGIHELEWIPAAFDLPSGMYVIRLSTSSGQFTQKLIKN